DDKKFDCKLYYLRLVIELVYNTRSLSLWRAVFKTKKSGIFILSSSVLEYKMTKCTSKWTTFFILTYIPNYIQNDL
ncbi:TPA: hypothetical protein ACF3U8_002936, partial [Enterococcus faecium]